VNVLVWHVHGSWTTSLVQGRHRYLLPVVPGRGADGRGRGSTWEWPASAVEVTPEELRDRDIDVVIVQDARHEELARAWTGRDLPKVWLEHNAPQGRISEMVHPVADRDDVLLVHVTHTNALFWDSGSAPTVVIEHGVPDPGHRFSGELARAVVVVNEPARRGRVVGADLVERLATVAPIDVYGIGVDSWVDGRTAAGVPALRSGGDIPQTHLHDRMALHRVYVHPFRWTSLGLSLIEAMYLGMPVVALATTEVPLAVPPEAGVVSNRFDRLASGLRQFVDDPEVARRAGVAAREAAKERFALSRFLDDWDAVLERVAGRRRAA
jgi:Glycosyl transferases group 1